LYYTGLIPQLINARADFLGVGGLLVGVVRAADERAALDVLEA
jgi:hypothetical protein